MPDVVERLEATRRTLSMRQVEVAARLAITQGHYSKVVRRLVPPGSALLERIELWLTANAPDATPYDDLDARLDALAKSLRDQSAALLSLLSQRRSARDP